MGEGPSGMEMIPPQNLEARLRVVVYLDGEELVDEVTAGLLYLVDSWGSLLRASKIVGIPYSRAWERIARIERLLGGRIIERKRGGPGGGGARLTSLGRQILDYYLDSYRRITGKPFRPPARRAREERIVVVSGSHDFLLSSSVGLLREEGYPVEVHWTGSGGGLMGVMVGDIDIAGVHLLDPSTGEYNVRAYESLGLAGTAVLVEGYWRDQGFMSRKPMTLDDILEGLLTGRLRLANRQAGSGTRILLDSILAREAEKRGVPRGALAGRIRGYESNYRTHIDVAEAVSRGDADVGLGLLHAARLYGLYYIHVAWERYDLLVARRLYGNTAGRRLLEALMEAIGRSASRLEGYRVGEGLGKVIRS